MHLQFCNKIFIMHIMYNVLLNIPSETKEFHFSAERLNIWCLAWPYYFLCFTNIARLQFFFKTLLSNHKQPSTYNICDLCLSVPMTMMKEKSILHTAGSMNKCLYASCTIVTVMWYGNITWTLVIWFLANCELMGYSNSPFAHLTKLVKVHNNVPVSSPHLCSQLSLWVSFQHVHIHFCGSSNFRMVWQVKIFPSKPFEPTAALTMCFWHWGTLQLMFLTALAGLLPKWNSYSMQWQICSLSTSMLAGAYTLLSDG